MKENKRRKTKPFSTLVVAPLSSSDEGARGIGELSAPKLRPFFDCCRGLQKSRDFGDKVLGRVLKGQHKKWEFDAKGSIEPCLWF